MKASSACVLTAATVQGTFELYSSKYFSLAEWIVVAGAAIGAFAVSVPNLHYLRLYSTISCILVLIFTIITIAVSCHDGEDCFPWKISMPAAVTAGYQVPCLSMLLFPCSHDHGMSVDVSDVISACCSFAIGSSSLQFLSVCQLSHQHCWRSRFTFSTAWCCHC